MMIQNLLFIFASFGCIPASKIQIKGNKFHGKNTHISEDIAGNFGNIKNFFTVIRKDPDACNYYAPNQARCQRVFVNIEALTKNPWWMKIDLQTIMPELKGDAMNLRLMFEVLGPLRLSFRIFCIKYAKKQRFQLFI